MMKHAEDERLDARGKQLHECIRAVANEHRQVERTAPVGQRRSDRAIAVRIAQRRVEPLVIAAAPRHDLRWVESADQRQRELRNTGRNVPRIVEDAPPRGLVAPAEAPPNDLLGARQRRTVAPAAADASPLRAPGDAWTPQR